MWIITFPYIGKSEAGNVRPVSSVLSSQIAGGYLWSEKTDCGNSTKQFTGVIHAKIKILSLFKARVGKSFQFLFIVVESLFLYTPSYLTTSLIIDCYQVVKRFSTVRIREDVMCKRGFCKGCLKTCFTFVVPLDDTITAYSSILPICAQILVSICSLEKSFQSLCMTGPSFFFLASGSFHQVSGF